MPKLQCQSRPHSDLTEAPILSHLWSRSEEGSADIRYVPFRKRIIAVPCGHVNLKTVSFNSIVKSIGHVNFLALVV